MQCKITTHQKLIVKYLLIQQESVLNGTLVGVGGRSTNTHFKVSLPVLQFLLKGTLFIE